MDNINETTFELFGAVYTRKANGYCYVQCNGETSKTYRIGKAEFEARYAEYAAMDMTLTEIESEEIAEAMDEIPAEQFCEMVEKMNREQNERNEFTNISKEDVVDAILSENKKKRVRKSKDIAYDGNGVTLTAKQVDFIRHLPDTNFWERGLDSAVWTDVLADEIGGQFAGKPMTTGAMISTLCEKGLGVRSKEKINNRTVTAFKLTGLGKVIAAELGLN